ncbi:UPF0280 family protein [Thermodesulfobacteriota bacterium]
MPLYRERKYRRRIKTRDLVSFNVTVKETDLWVSTETDLEQETRDLVLNCRHQLEGYIRSHPRFMTSLQPYPEDPLAPFIIRDMIRATAGLGVGPMASVAGAIAQSIAQDLLKKTKQVIVENGGDIYLKANRSTTVSVFAGESPLSERVGLKIDPARMPVGICTSSGTVGHSLSKGGADAVSLLASSAALADAAATALGNLIKSPQDLKRATLWAKGLAGILGGVIIMGERMVTWGDVELVKL